MVIPKKYYCLPQGYRIKIIKCHANFVELEPLLRAFLLFQCVLTTLCGIVETHRDVHFRIFAYSRIIANLSTF